MMYNDSDILVAIFFKTYLIAWKVVIKIQQVTEVTKYTA